MARIRTIKPHTWTDQKFVSLSMGARLLFIGMISHADDDGRLFASASRLGGDVFPNDDVRTSQILAWRAEIVALGLAQIYAVGKVEYAVLPNWKKHQKISKPYASILPPPPGTIEDAA